MVVFSLTNAPQRVRGLISRYCLEVRAGLFVGRLDKRMRLKLWAAVEETATARTSAVMCWARPTAQGYAFKSLGPGARQPVRYDGLWLVAEQAEKKGGEPKPSPDPAAGGDDSGSLR
jgi:CRISPR-associated protein Cas2